MVGVARVLCSCWSYGWLLGCLAVVREFWLVVRAFCSCQRVLVVC